ncbi:MAG: ATP-binding protein [Rhodanobacteraceae bacterium]|nr:MAG: ATP-binding protein [Rhodanobacteraceae bacterium]
MERPTSSEIPSATNSNPLTEALVPYIPLSAMPQALHHEPLSNVDWKSSAPEMREPLLSLQDQHFFPTGYAVEIASSIQNAIRASFDRRNPLAPAEQKRINQLALASAVHQSQSLPALSNPASGGIIAAETGLGKTTIVRRALEVIAPQQFVIHGRSEACGWSTLTQILYLRVDFPTNGTRGALIERILGGVDSLIGTDYAGKRLRLRNIDASLFLVTKVLTMHRVGMLFLDELQWDNFGRSPLSWEFVRLFLSLLNVGIPVILSGHPRAFEGLSQEAQVMRRFSDIGYFSLSRAKTGEESWWKRVLVPGIMRFNLCDEILDQEEILDAAHPRSAGVPGIFVKLYMEAQRIALRRGGTAATLTADDFRRACESPRTVQLVKMARWLVGTASPEAGYSDLSRDSPAAEHTEHVTPAPRSPIADPTSAASTVEKLRRAEKRDRRVSAAREARNRELLKTLRPDDLRVAARSLDILAGLDKHQPDLSLDDPDSKSSKR